MDKNTPLNTQTLFLFSTSGSQSSIEKHNKALRALSANLIYFIFGHNITSEEYSNLLKMPISRGGAVTGQGLKSGIIPFLDQVETLAKETGAVNTVINKNGKLHGYNTDAFGFESAINSHIKNTGLPIKKAIIYGNGGVSGVASHVLKNLNIDVTMAGRNQERVNKKMDDLKLAQFKGPYDLVVNATPISSSPLEEAVGLLDTLRDCKMVFDHNMPEKDEKTNYIEEYCNANKIHFIPGKDMYVPQMIKQWKLLLNGAMDKNNKELAVTEKAIISYWNI